MSTTVIPKNAVTLEQAQKWIANWKNDQKMKRSSVTAYFIPHQDITDIQKEKGWINYRAYNAITDEGEFKLLIVGVDKDGNDMVNYPKSGALENAQDDYVYDLTRPCPSYCSDNVWWQP